MATDFQGASRDTRRSKTPQQMWEFARNILLTKGFLSVTNENGFKKVHDIPGTQIGKIETNNHIVYMSIDGDFSCIGYVNTELNEETYIPVLRTTNPNFKFNLHCPIEGVYSYNYKNELIIAFCDGVKNESSKPKLINIFNLPVAVDSTFELINPEQIGLLNMFAEASEADIDVSYDTEGNLNADVIYITYSYVFNDNTDTAFYPIHTVAYVSTGLDIIERRSLVLDFTNLDTNFSKIRIGFVVKTNNSIVGYQSNILNYEGTSLKTTINSFTNFASIAPDELILTKQTFDKIHTMTRQSNRVLVGHTVKEEFVDFQKYANMLELGLYEYPKNGSVKDIHNYPTFMPDEVYAIYVSLQLKDATDTRSFHIPGPVLTSNDLGVLDETVINNTFGLDIVGQNYKSFHLFNTGNKIAINNNKWSFGKWQNEEIYPNTDDFNSTIDYAGAPLGGEDLRNTFIRYHRIPGLDTIATHNLLSLPNIKNPENTSVKFGIKIENFDAVVPLEIRNKIQGYKLSFVKRNRGDSLVESNTVLLKSTVYSQLVDSVNYDTTTVVHGLTGSERGYTDLIIRIREEFNTAKAFATELFKFTPRIDPTFVKCNYIFHVPKLPNVALEDNVLSFPEESFANVDSSKYLIENNIAATTRFTETGLQIDFRNTKYLNTRNEYSWKPLKLSIDSNLNQIADVEVLVNTAVNGVRTAKTINSYAGLELALNATLFNLQKNVYSGFKSSNLVTIGRIAVRNGISSTRILYEGGDVFTNNKLDLTVQQNYDANTRFKLDYTGLYSPLNNVKAVTTDSPLNTGDADGILGYTDPSDLNELNGLDYSVQVEGDESFSSLNDITTILTFDRNDNFIDYFPYRINKGVVVPNETLQTRGLRTFLSDDYYEIQNDRGPILALRATNRAVYIQTRYSLFLASIKDKLNTGESETFLGESDLFDRLPEEIMYNENKGYIGSTSQFACMIFKGGYITIDQIQGKIFIVTSSATEISAINMRNYFKDTWDIGKEYSRPDLYGDLQRVDNPYISVGHLVSYDDDYNRLIFTKKKYRLKEEFKNVVTFNGEFYLNISTPTGIDYTLINDPALLIDFNNEMYFINESITWSFALDGNKWICEHDYFPNSMQYTNIGLFSTLNSLTSNAQVYKHNDNETTGFYYGKHFDSYIDIIFNSRLDLSKMYQAVYWNSEVVNKNGSLEYFETIDKLLLYNDYQCSGYLDVKNGQFDIVRTLENQWQLNGFRDIVINRSLPLVSKDGVILENNLNINKSWFDKSDFISNFIVVRLLIDNTNNKQKYIHTVNVLSRISNR